MGLQLPARTGQDRRPRRLSLLALLAVGAVVLSGCSAETRGEFERFAMPEPITEQAEHTLSLWQGAWIAALITGVVVWGLIFYAAFHYRRRTPDEVPIQTRYNLPLEIFYTVFPIIMVVVLFAKTVDTQNVILDDEGKPDHEITVVGQQWTWTFNYPYDGEGGDYVHEGGTANIIPTLVIPEGETTEFQLVSPDVIHSFGVPGFLTRMDVFPGHTNTLRVTPKRTGTFAGKCVELCGVAHSRMIFNLEVVSPEEYDAHLDELAAAGQISDEPLLGGKYADEQAGLDTDASEEESE